MDVVAEMKKRLYIYIYDEIFSKLWPREREREE
jgi:hypothetical protein